MPCRSAHHSFKVSPVCPLGSVCLQTLGVGTSRFSRCPQAKERAISGEEIDYGNSFELPSGRRYWFCNITERLTDFHLSSLYTNLEARLRTDNRSIEHPAILQREPGSMRRANDAVADQLTFRKRPAEMRAGFARAKILSPRRTSKMGTPSRSARVGFASARSDSQRPAAVWNNCLPERTSPARAIDCNPPSGTSTSR